MTTAIDPRLRVRELTVRRTRAKKKTLTNSELLDAWYAEEEGKLSDYTRAKYRNYIRDALAYVRDEETGELAHVSTWTREMVEDYEDHATANYCSNYQTVGAAGRIPLASCRANVWQGGIAPTAAIAHCSKCKLFEEPPVYKRLMALARFFTWLERGGVVQANFVSGVAAAARAKAPDPGDHEKKRNPSLEEVRRLVNGTVHPRNRAFYASYAYWWCRPNEMLLLDRYASFGLRSPGGVEPPGFEEGFRVHPYLKSFEEGGDLVYIPKVKGDRDKRKGNRWLVIPRELRPILHAYFEWWDKHVERVGAEPLTTALWITERGTPIQRTKRGDIPSDLYENHFFYQDCERLGLMNPEDRKNPLLAWTGHAMRHFGERVCHSLALLPDEWKHHFRGDKIGKGARGHYHVPRPENVREMYLQHIPPMGFHPYGRPPERGGVPLPIGDRTAHDARVGPL